MLEQRDTCLWTTTRFVHTVRGHGHRLQSVWIATCSCEISSKFSCSRTREEDRESSSSTRSSSRFGTKQRLQHTQWRIKSDDSWHGQCRVVRAMRNNSKGAKLRMPYLLESRNCLLHLRTSLERKWSQPTFSPMAIGRFLNQELRYQEGATSRSSARQNWSTERAIHSPQCSKGMSQKEIWRNSRPLPQRLNISWFAAQNWLDWGDVHCDGQLSTGKPLLLSIAWRVRKISEKPVYHTEQIRKKCTNETPIRLPRFTCKYAPSPPWIWRRATWTSSPLSISKVAFVVFFIQYLMVSVEWTLVELIN